MKLRSFEEFKNEIVAQRKPLELRLNELQRERTVRDASLMDKLFRFTINEDKEQPIFDTGCLNRIEELSGEVSQLRNACSYLNHAIAIERIKDSIVASLTASIDSVSSLDQKMVGDMKELLNLQVINASHSNLATYKEDVVAWCHRSIQQHLRTKLQKQLQELNWPKSIDPKAWASNEVECMLQTVDGLSMLSLLMGRAGIDRYSDAMGVMMEPIKIAFDFHFNSEGRPTTRLDKPEWYLAYVSQLLSTHLPFFALALGRSPDGSPLTEDGKGSGDDPEMADLFVDALVTMLRDHLKSKLGLITQDPSLLLHTIKQYRELVLSVKSTAVDLSPQLMGIFCDRKLDWIGLEKAGLEPVVGEIFKTSSWLPSAASVDATVSAAEGATPASGECHSKAIDAILGLLEDYLPSLLTIPDEQVQADYLVDIIYALLRMLWDKIDFDIPPFHDTKEDVDTLIVIANSLDFFIGKLLELGESIEIMNIAGQNGVLVDILGYDASEMRGSLFNEHIESFEGLLERVMEDICHYAWDSFSTTAYSFARSMHYGVLREAMAFENISADDLLADTDITNAAKLHDGKMIGMHDDLRAALVSISQVVASLKLNLVSSLLTGRLYPFILKSLQSFLNDRLIFQNFYNKAGVRQLGEDLAMIKETLERLLPGQPIGLAMAKAIDSHLLLSAATSEMGIKLKKALIADDYDTASEILESLSISSLSVAECEKLFSLLR